MLRVVDTNLAFEEADEIRTLAELEWLIWTAVKDYGDVTRDTNVLRRLLQRPRKHYEPMEDSQGSTEPPTPPSRSEAGELWSELAALELAEGLAPARPSKNDKFRRLTIQTAHGRCLDFKHRLADSFPLHPGPLVPPSDAMGGLESGLDSTFEELEREWDPSLNVPTIHATVLAGAVLDEWDALRDLIHNAGGQYSSMTMWEEGGEEVVDAGNALSRQRRVWESIRDIGLPTSIAP